MDELSVAAHRSGSFSWAWSSSLLVEKPNGRETSWDQWQHKHGDHHLEGHFLFLGRCSGWGLTLNRISFEAKSVRLDLSLGVPYRNP